MVEPFHDSSISPVVHALIRLVDSVDYFGLVSEYCSDVGNAVERSDIIDKQRKGEMMAAFRINVASQNLRFKPGRVD